METETMDKLYLEYSQITSAKTKRELELEDMIMRALEIKKLWLPSNIPVQHGYEDEYRALSSMFIEFSNLISSS